MAFVHGKSSTVLYGAYDLSAYCRQSSVAFTKDVPETTTYGKSSRDFAVEGLRAASMTISGLDDFADDAMDEQIHNAFTATAATTPLTISGQSTALGNIAYLCVPWDTDRKVDTPFDNVLTFDGTFQADGGAKRGQWILALAAVTTTGDKTSVDAGEAWASGGRANLHVTAFNGTDCTIIIKDSSDDISFSAVSGGGFAQFTGIGSESILIPGAIAQYRLVNFAGTFTSVTAAVALGQ